MDGTGAGTFFLSPLRGSPSEDDICTAIDAIKLRFANDAGMAAELARILAASGSTLSVRADVVADVASTGGPTSLSTLISPLYLRAGGAVVPKLGVPGRPAGGIDCLAQVRGYRTELSVSEVSEIVHDSGYAHFLAKGDMAPLDGKMFKLRQAMGAQGIPTLVAASLLSKKLAVGVKHAGLDIRVAPHGNFGNDWPTAEENARLFVRAARMLGIDATPVLTDGRYPYQPYLGRRESLIALDEIFRGGASPWLKDHSEVCRALAMACLPPDLHELVENVPATELKRHFEANLVAQGADIGSFDEVVEETRKKHTGCVTALNDGFCSYPLGGLREAIVEWQKLRLVEHVPFPDPVGLILLVSPGSWVARGTPIATVRAPGEIMSDVILKLGQIIGTPARLPSGTSFEAIDD